MKVCYVEGCSRAVNALGLCSGHYRRSKGLIPSDQPIREYGTVCSAEGCARKHYAKGMCSLHYRRVRLGLELHAPIREYSPGEWGDWYVGFHGYVLRVRTLGTVKETQRQHREVMKEILGRDLLPEETVHHKNGDRADNRPENLELWSTSQPYGQRVSDKVSWAKEILRIYGEDYSGNS